MKSDTDLKILTQFAPLQRHAIERWAAANELRRMFVEDPAGFARQPMPASMRLTFRDTFLAALAEATPPCETKALAVLAHIRRSVRDGVVQIHEGSATMADIDAALAHLPAEPVTMTVRADPAAVAVARALTGPGLRACGHPLGSSAWCYTCAEAEYEATPRHLRR